ncbi:hypothetical protein FI667_g15927, partial [Globisporangium splendens]
MDYFSTETRESSSAWSPRSESDANFAKFGDDRISVTPYATFPTCFTTEDYFAMLVSIFLITPLALVVYLALWILAPPCFAALSAYLASFTMPLKIIPLTTNFYVFSALRRVLALPAIAVTFVYRLHIAVVIGISSLALSIATWRIVSVSHNWAVLEDMRQVPEWTWNDVVVGLMGSMHREGLWEFLLFFPTLVVVTPVFKYMLIHSLSCKFTNQWTIPLCLSDDNAVDRVEQAVVWTAVAEDDRKDSDNDCFSAHCPLPPPDRATPTTIIVQLTTILVLLEQSHLQECRHLVLGVDPCSRQVYPHAWQHLDPRRG